MKISSPYIMTSLNQMRKLYEAVVYINENNIEGSFVEYGVYKGGSKLDTCIFYLDELTVN